MASRESLAQLKARLWSAWGMSEARTRTLSRCSCSSCSHAFFFCISPLRNLLLLSNSSSAPSISFSLLCSTLYLLKPHFLLFYLLLLSVCLHFISDKKKERKDDEDEDENQREREGDKAATKLSSVQVKIPSFGLREEDRSLRNYGHTRSFFKRLTKTEELLLFFIWIPRPHELSMDHIEKHRTMGNTPFIYPC